MRRRLTLTRTSAAALLAAATLLAAPQVASAHDRPSGPTTLVEGLAGPLQIDASRGDLLVGQSFSGAVSTVDRRGRITDLTHAGVDGVAWGRGRSVLFTHTDFDQADAQGVAESEIRMLDHRGQVSTVADLRAYEEAHNPDAGNTYGFQGLSPECAASLPPDPGLTPYGGLLDSHPYALAVSHRTTYVAEAGGNDILAVDRDGAVRTVAVLPPQPVTVTAEAAAGGELPDCVVGATYNFEPVPTDVEVGRDRMLYVTTLPGGPEDGSLGPQGSVYKVDPDTGATTRIATGFGGATNLALSSRGTIYVSELYANRVSRVVAGHPELVADIASPAALEWRAGRLYVGADVFGPNGKVLTIRAR